MTDNKELVERATYLDQRMKDDPVKPIVNSRKQAVQSSQILQQQEPQPLQNVANANTNSNNGIAPSSGGFDLKSFMEIIHAQEEKTRMTVMLELLKESNLEYITEYPNFTYTKAMTKLSTWRASIAECCSLDNGWRVNESGIERYHPELDETDQIVKEMCTQFMRKNVSHKRRRSHELVNALRGEDASSNVLDHEHKGLRRFLGLR